MTDPRRQGLIDLACVEIRQELTRARVKHAPYNSRHEGYAVMLEEMDELWEEIKLKNPDKKRMREEALQVASTALAFAIEVCSE